MSGGGDLRDKPWIPVRLLTGESARLGLRQVFEQAHEIEDLELPVPLAAAGLMRTLAAITARIAVDEDDRLDDLDVAGNVQDWIVLRRRVVRTGRFDPDAVDSYPRHAQRAWRDILDLLTECLPMTEDTENHRANTPAPGTDGSLFPKPAQRSA